MNSRVHDQESTPILKKFFNILTSQDRRRFWLLAILSILVALSETVGVASVLPLMTIVMDPDTLQKSSILNRVFIYFGVLNYTESVVWAGSFCLAAITLGNISSAYYQWQRAKFVGDMRVTLSHRLLSIYVNKPYAFHVEHDAPSLIKVIFTDVDMFLSGFVDPLLIALSRCASVVLLLALIIQKDPIVALSLGAAFGAIYLFLYKMIRSRHVGLGEKANRAATERYQIVVETLGGIKELIVSDCQEYQTNRFKASTIALVRSLVLNDLIAQTPRQVLETFAFGGAIVAMLMLTIHDSAQTAIPTIALYIFAGYRLLPAMQRLYDAALAMRFNLPSINFIEKALADDEIIGSRSSEGKIELPMKIEHSLSLKHVDFGYSADCVILDDFSLEIRPNECLGLAGSTGAGKSTVGDLILGLQLPHRGTIEIDGKAITKDNIKAWRRQIGYVPQTVFLANASVEENIAFGSGEDSLDGEAVISAARKAQADEFIQKLPNGYQTVVGERGVKLSGGQRQRLGIARALYRDPDVLIFDEATSALDGFTENQVMSAIRDISKTKTIIIIAHRLNTLRACDRIVLLDRGKIVGDGDFEGLLNKSSLFRKLTNEASASYEDAR